MSKIWFITGASRGFGREFARAALGRGDKVAATARNVDDLADLTAEFRDAIMPLTLDVTDHAAVASTVTRAAEHFGRLDIVVNNAGYGLFGMVEELTEQQLRDQMEVNFFGLAAVTTSVLPILRAQGSGHIVQISTIGGVAAFPGLGGYHASKWAVEGYTESLAQEVAGFGIRVTLVEPAGYSTDWMGSSATFATPNPAYDDVRTATNATYAEHPVKLGDPAAAGPALLTVVDSEQPPLRVLFGEMGLGMTQHLYASRLQTWDDNKEITIAAQG
jgi:NAD(P)-dependent dehydrogenase (short-subunit alcohol dehydrogenase family)